MNWFYASAQGQAVGPYSLEDMRSLHVRGEISGSTQVIAEGAGIWIPLTQALAAEARAVPFPPPPSAPAASTRKILPAFLLCFLLGMFGAHRFYVGKVGTGALMAALTVVLAFTGAGLIVTGLWALVDVVLIIIGAFTDEYELPLTEWV